MMAAANEATPTGGYKVVLVTTRGLAPQLREELREVFDLDSEPVKGAPDSWVSTRVDRAERLVELVYVSRIAQRVVLELASPEIRQNRDGLADLEDAIRQVDLAPLFGPESRFAVRCERRGRQAFGSPEAASVAGGAVAARVRWQTGRTPTVHLDDPDLLFRLQILDNQVLFGLDLSAPRSLHRRGYLVRPHRAGVKPTVAAALLRLCGWAPGETLLDPMCGGGTFVLEAAWRMARVPAGHLRRASLPFRRLPLFDDVDPEATCARHDEAVDLDHVSGLAAADISSTTLASARRNARAAGVESRIEWRRAAIGELSSQLEGRTFHRVVVNPPYGIRMGSTSQVDRTYRRLFRCLDRVVAPGGTALVLTPREHQAYGLADAFGFPARRHSVWVGDLKLGAFVLGPRDR